MINIGKHLKYLEHQVHQGFLTPGYILKQLSPQNILYLLTAHHWQV